MILGDLSKVFEDEQSIMEAVENNILTQQQRYTQQSDMGFKKPTRWSKILKTLSSYGMNYDDELFKNMRAIPADKALQPKDDLMLNSSLYNGILGNWKEKGEEEKPFREKTIEQKIQILRKLAMQPELEDILDTMANESIVYDDDEAYIAQPFLDTALIQELTEKQLEITKIKLPEGLKTIEGCAFSRCTNLTELQLPTSLKNLDYFTFFCSNIKQIVVLDETIKFDYSVLENCSNLKTIVIKGKTDKGIPIPNCKEVFDFLNNKTQKVRNEIIENAIDSNVQTGLALYLLENKESEYFRNKWKDVLEKGDPYYNPNLSLERADFALKQ